ncbi:hypothetical protein BDB00DRAFT_790150 [Zychaea mexicana]|uniref:uncharacterized protein n=1 Tax=Zychaea mexicana TaxID=64656 RepID=UPI0022FEB03F|nr:uncharacterized protein BDB00DRAFT_790150 [Zychaea mexicana]KAI9490635.1 hypothetical protein BDB00DRAFT_790150 [Zychaea mexicana]
MTERWQCLMMPGAADGLDTFLNVVFGTKGENTRSNHGLLLECLEDKEEIMEDGVENPFIERPQYPLPATAYILLYADTDFNGNDCICAQLYQSRFDDDSIETLLSRLFYYPPPTPMIRNDTADYLGALGFFAEEEQQLNDKHAITNTIKPHQWKWDILAARDQDMMEKERLRQLQRPDFFAKPRPKPVPKKRNTIDLKFLLERQEAGGSGSNKPSPTRAAATAASSSAAPTTTAKGKRKEQPSSPEQMRKKKTPSGAAGGSSDTWESENKDLIKNRLWSTMSKERGHDRRSEKSKLLYLQIYQSCRYVFRLTMKDKQVNSKLLDQIIDKHLDFYEELDIFM